MMKFFKILVTLIISLLILTGLFFLLIFSTQQQPEKTEDLTIRYVKRPPYLLPTKPSYTAITWDIGFATSGAGADLYFEGGKTARPHRDSVSTWLEGIKNQLRSFENTDFLFLQEVDHHSKRSFFVDQSKFIDSLFTHHACCFAFNHNVLFIPVPLGHPYGVISSGIELISTAFPLESMRQSLEKRGNFLEKPFTQNPCCIVNHYRLKDGRTLVMINVYNKMSAKGDMPEKLAKNIIALMVTEYEKGNYVMAGGNWGVDPITFSDTFSSLFDTSFFNGKTFSTKLIPDGWNVYFDSDIPTVRKLNIPYQQGVTPVSITDFFIASPNIYVTKVQTIPFNFQYSAHNPVQITFGFKAL